LKFEILKKVFDNSKWLGSKAGYFLRKWYCQVKKLLVGGWYFINRKTAWERKEGTGEQRDQNFEAGLQTRLKKVLQVLFYFFSRYRGYFVWSGLFCVVIIILLIVGLTSRPDSYRPQPGLANSREVSIYLTHKLGPDFHNNIQLDEPFAVLVEQGGLNDIISRWSWPVYFDNVKFDLPMVEITGEDVSLMGTVKYGFVPFVATISISPEILDNGKLVLNLYEVRAGKVNITPFIKRVARKAVAKNLSEKKHEVWRRFSEAILNNDPFDPVFPAGSDRKIRLVKVELTEGSMTLHFVPAEEFTF
jgi:hypothetical protein